jgi:23S rRNA (guanosine2251-2'-O)-methyltransferase
VARNDFRSGRRSGAHEARQQEARQHGKDGGKPGGPRGGGSDDSRSGQGRPRRGGRSEHRTPSDVAQIWGYHPVREALRSSRREILRLWATAEAASRLASEITARGIEPQIVGLDDISARLPGDSVHQGLLLEARPLEPIDLADLPAKGLVLVLDQVTDPHNVGAIVRTAAAFGVDAIVTTERHSPAMTGVLAKSASGGLEHVPLCTVVNLARALETLGDMGYLRVGLDSDGPASLENTALERPLALVLGAEGKGLRRLSRENCDTLARLDMPGAIRSLNVSNACAVALTITRLKLAPAAAS